MTNEKAIIILNSLKQYYNDKNEDSYVGFDDEDNEAIDMAIKAIEQTRWIHVSERLPEENISVIGTTKYNDIYETELYNDCGKHKWYADGNYDVPIVAWIPLPEPYQPPKMQCEEDKE